MPANDMYLRVHASLPWGTGGLPAFPVSDPRRWQPGVELRTLPDGTPLLRAQLGDGIRVTRLSAPPASVEIRTAHRIMDAVMHQDGQVTIVERPHGLNGTVRTVRPDGTTAWGMEDRSFRGVARLLADQRGRIFLVGRSGEGSGELIRVDDGSGHLVARGNWDDDAVLHPDGRLGFARRPLVDRWVLLDIDTGTESLVECHDDRWDRRALAATFGIDAEGRMYGLNDRGELGRLTPAGALDWLLTVRGAAVSGLHGVTVLVSGRDHGGTLIHQRGQVGVDPAIEAAAMILIGRHDDGGYVLLHRKRQELLHLDPAGRLVMTRPVTDDCWLNGDPPLALSMSRPAQSSVTPGGEVIFGVATRTGLHVIGLASSPQDDPEQVQP